MKSGKKLFKIRAEMGAFGQSAVFQWKMHGESALRVKIAFYSRVLKSFEVIIVSLSYDSLLSKNLS